MGINKKHLCIDEVLMMYRNGIPKKKIAIIVSVTEKTVAKWINEVNKTEKNRILELEKEVEKLKIKLSKYE